MPAWVTYGMLGLYGLGILYAILAPPKQHDPQRGMAIGCLMFAFLLLILAAIAFTLGLVFEIKWLREGVTGLCLYVIAFAILSLIEAGVKRLRKRKNG